MVCIYQKNKVDCNYFIKNEYNGEGNGDKYYNTGKIHRMYVVKFHKRVVGEVIVEGTWFIHVEDSAWG